MRLTFNGVYGPGLCGDVWLVTKGKLAVTALGALGVVFGDIGTSPLYAFGQCFTSRFPPSPQNILGILSLIIWALIVVVCIKYIGFMMRADCDGEGGILALLAQIAGRPRTEGTPIVLSGIAFVALFGAAALYGDGVITPAISVVSAMEGLNVSGGAATAFVVPGAIIVLALLFLFQHRGTGRIGKVFGPVMLLWFSAIGIGGTISIVQHPEVFRAFNPVFGIQYFLRNGLTSLVVFGAVVLCVTGAEALYADLGHFGRKPIVTAWFAIAFPALLLNYLGQGAHLLVSPQHDASHSFYALFPSALLIPMVVLSTCATIIASQSVITGVFSLTHQASQLGLAPDLREVHTSKKEPGQIYIPAVNAALAIGCISVVLAFRTSSGLSGAYGLAVSVTMLATTIAYAHLTRTRFKWPIVYAAPVIALFAGWDVAFVLGNLSKLSQGAWLPLLIAGALFTLSITWDRGRSKLLAFICANSTPIDEFIGSSKRAADNGTVSVFFTTEENAVPAAVKNWWVRSRVDWSTVVLIRFLSASRPYVPQAEKVKVDQEPRLIRVEASYGFKESPSLDDVIKCENFQRDVSEELLFYYMILPEIVPDTSSEKLPAWQRALFIWMRRNSPSHEEIWNIPPDRMIRYGVRVPI